MGDSPGGFGEGMAYPYGSAIFKGLFLQYPELIDNVGFTPKIIQKNITKGGGNAPPAGFLISNGTA